MKGKGPIYTLSFRIKSCANGTKEASGRLRWFRAQGSRHALHFLNRTPRTELVATFSPDEKEIQWGRTHLEPYGVQLYMDYGEMIKQKGLEAVVIETITTAHADESIKAMQAGLHVLCEKPLSTSVEVVRTTVTYSLQQAQSLTDLFPVAIGGHRRQGTPTLEGDVRLLSTLDQSYRDGWSRMDSSAIGRPSVFRSQTCDMLDPSGFFVAYAKFSGGIFVDCNIHDIDLALWFFGQDSIVKSVTAVGITAVQPELRKYEDVNNGVGVVGFWGGKSAYFYSSRMMAAGQHDRTEIIGTEGKLTVYANPQGALVDIYETNGIRRGIPQHYYGRFEHAFVTEANEFIVSCLGNLPVPLKLSGAVQAVKIGCTLQEAFNEGTKIWFDETGRRVERAQLYIRVVGASSTLHLFGIIVGRRGLCCVAIHRSLVN